MPWLEFKNGLLLKLADVLQTLAAWLTPKVHAPGLQEDNHPQAEDDFRAQWMKRYKTSHPPEDWLTLVAESSSDENAGPIGGEVARDRLQFPARRAAAETQTGVVQRKTEPTPPPDPGEQPRSSQQPGSKRENPAESIAKSEMPHQSRVGPEPEARLVDKQIPEAGTEHLELQLSTAVSDAATRNSSEPVEAPKKSKPRSSKKAPWLFQAVRKIVTRFRPATESSAVPQPRHTAAQPASTSDTEPQVIFNEADASITGEQEPQWQSGTVRAQVYQNHSSLESSKAVPAGLPRLSHHRQSLPEQDKTVANYDGEDASRIAPQTSLRRQREIATPVIPWPAPTVRVAAAENELWSFPDSRSRERNLTTAASTSWKQPPDREIAPSLPFLPSEFRPSAEKSGDASALYPWPELPQVVEEDPGEPRRLLLNHERQMRILREQRGAW